MPRLQFPRSERYPASRRKTMHCKGNHIEEMTVWGGISHVKGIVGLICTTETCNPRVNGVVEITPYTGKQKITDASGTKESCRWIENSK